MSASTVAGVLADGLARAGVSRVFDATAGVHPLAPAAAARGLPVIAAASGDAACVMAAVTGDLTDAPGAALVSLDDGVAGILDGVAHAAGSQGALLVALAPHADVPLLAPAVKGTVAVEATSAAHAIAHGCQLALSDPRGPVVLVVGGAVAARSAVPVAAACRPATLPAPPSEALDAAGAAIGAAARPVVLAGRQCDAAVTPWLRAFAEAVPVPVVTTPPARGILAEPHPLALGVLGAPATAALLARADLVIALGVNDAELWPGALPKGTAVVRLARHTATAPPAAVAEATGDLALILEELAPRLREREHADWDVAELDRLKRAVSVPGPPAFTVRRVVELVRAATPAGTIAAADVPAVAWWQTVAPRELLVGAGPGFAVLAAVATRLVHPGRTVVGFTTPGGLDRHASALAAASTPAAGAPLVAVAFAAPGATDGAGVAAAAGWRCLDAVDEAAFAFALERALSARGPTAIVARVRGGA